MARNGSSPLTVRDHHWLWRRTQETPPSRGNRGGVWTEHCRELTLSLYSRRLPRPSRAPVYRLLRSSSLVLSVQTIPLSGGEIAPPKRNGDELKVVNRTAKFNSLSVFA